jgi:hypothetical protein
MNGLRQDLRERRENFRREIELEVDPHIAVAAASERAAFDLAQASIRTILVLNGGAFVAMPAIVTLFGLDASAIRSQLVLTAVLFTGGLAIAWVAGICGFSALTVRANGKTALANAMRARVSKSHYPENADVNKWDAQDADGVRTSDRQRRRFKYLCIAAIGLCVLSGTLFIGGVWQGGNTVLHAPQKPVPAPIIRIPTMN